MRIVWPKLCGKVCGRWRLHPEYLSSLNRSRGAHSYKQACSLSNASSETVKMIRLILTAWLLSMGLIVRKNLGFRSFTFPCNLQYFNFFLERTSKFANKLGSLCRMSSWRKLFKYNIRRFQQVLTMPTAYNNYSWNYLPGDRFQKMGNIVVSQFAQLVRIVTWCFFSLHWNKK